MLALFFRFSSTFPLEQKALPSEPIQHCRIEPTVGREQASPDFKPQKSLRMGTGTCASLKIAPFLPANACTHTKSRDPGCYRTQTSQSKQCAVLSPICAIPGNELTTSARVSHWALPTPLRNDYDCCRPEGTTYQVVAAAQLPLFSSHKNRASPLPPSSAFLPLFITHSRNLIPTFLLPLPALPKVVTAHSPVIFNG